MTANKKRKLAEIALNDYESKEHKHNKIFEINVGGVEFVTMQSTLLNIKDTYFSKRFGGQYYNFMGPMLRGSYFIDRDGSLFSTILQFLRDQKSVILPDNFDELLKLKIEAKFYILPSLVDQIEDQLEIVSCEKKPLDALCEIPMHLESITEMLKKLDVNIVGGCVGVERM